MIFITFAVCVSIFMTSSLGVVVFVVYKRRFIYIFNVYHFDNTAVVGEWDGHSANRLTTPDGWL